MANKIIESRLIPFNLQKGEGVPSHISPSGTIYFDIISGLTYQNINSVGTWKEMYGSTSPFIVSPSFSGNSLAIDYINFNTNPSVPSPTGGTMFFDASNNALSYKPITPNNDVTVQIGQEHLIKIYNNTSSTITNGTPLHITGSTLGAPTVTKAIASDGNNIYFQVNGIATHDIEPNTFGFMTRLGLVHDVNLTAFTVGDLLFLSQTKAGEYVTGDKLYFTGRTTEIGHVLDNSANGVLEVSPLNELQYSKITSLTSNLLSADNTSTGAFDFTGLTRVSNTLFSIAPVKGWLVDNTTNPIEPNLKVIFYSGTTGMTTPYLNTDTSTYVLLNSASTITLQSTFPTSKQRVENILLGKVIHPNKTAIQNVNNTVDYSLSPMSAIRDLWAPLKLINQGIVISANGANLQFNKSSGTLWGNGINWVTSMRSPNSVTLSGSSPATFQYRTQTGGTTSDVTSIDPANYDVGGVVTAVGGGANSSTNQRVYVFPTGVVRVQYGQTVYSSLANAVAGIQTESFVEFANNRDNGILVGIISVNKNATNLSNTAEAVFIPASKFGEVAAGSGSAGGTTTLQQAYNNSSNPEIVTTIAQDGVQFRGGTGSDTDANIIVENNAGSPTGKWLANGSLSATTFNGNSLTLSSSASTIFLDNITQQQIKFFSGGTGVPTYNTYSAGAKIIFSDNISSTSSGYAIGVDVGSLWYGVDLAGNGHDWYAGTRKLASLIGGNGFQLFGLGGPTTVAMTISGTSTSGSKGGLGYMDFLRVYNNYPSATNPNKWFRTTSGGTLQILRDDYNATIFDLTNSGVLSVGGGNAAAVTSNDATSNYLSFNSNNSQIYDDGNLHIHSRGANQSMWINTNSGQINIGTQSPTATGGIASAVAFATGTVNGYVTINTGRTVTTSSAYGYLTTGGAGTYPGGSQSVSISLYANNRIWGQEIDAFSDERMKDIQGEISLEDGIKLVNNLLPIKYTWKKGDDKGIKAGYSAQQVIKSGFDHLVGLIPTQGLDETIDSDGFVSPKDTQFAMNYDQVTPYHGVVIKHLLEKIDDLQKQIDELKGK